MRSGGGERHTQVKTWARSDGTPIEELRPGLWYEGKISYVEEDIIFIDIGANYDAVLKLQPFRARKLTVGMEFPVELLKVDLQSGELLVQMEKDKHRLPEAKHLAGGEMKGKDKGKGKGKEKGKGKGTSETWHAPTDSQRFPDHDRRTPLEELEPGQIVTGTVKSTNKAGVFFDIGARSDARIFAPKHMTCELQVGDVVDLVVDWANPETHRIQVSYPGADSYSFPASMPTTKQSTASIDNGRKRVFAKLQKGMLLDGEVSGKSSKYVFVDIEGYEKHGHLMVEADMLPEFQIGDEIIGMEVMSVNQRTDEVYLSLDDPEIDESDASNIPPPTKQHPAAQRNQKLARPVGIDPSLPHVGSLVEGTITRVSASMVYVDIGSQNEAHLVVPPDLRRQFLKNDLVRGMLVESINQEMGHAVLSLEDPVLENSAPTTPKDRDHQRRPYDFNGEDGRRTNQSAASTKGRQQYEIRGKGRPASAGFSSPGRQQYEPRGKGGKGRSTSAGFSSDRDESRGKGKSAGFSSPGRTTPRQRPNSSGPRHRDAGQSDDPAREYGNSSGREYGHSSGREYESSSGRNQGKTPEVKKRPALEHPDGTPLQDLKVGDEVTGLVSKITNQVFLDFGAVVDGLLKLSENDVRKFRVGDQIEDALIDYIDLKKMRVVLSIPWELQEPAEVLHQ